MEGIVTEEELQALETAEQQTEEVVQTEGTQARDEHGRFVKKEGEEGPKSEATVPQGALHAERERRKGAEAELSKAKEQLAAIQKLREQVAARSIPQQQEQVEDPNGVEYLKRQIEELKNGQQRIGQTFDNQRLDQAEQAQIHAALQHSEGLFRQQQPDYDDAIRYVINARAHELSLYGMSPFEVRTALANEVADITKSAIEQGKDPAALGYEIAKARGYRSASEETGQPGAGVAKLDAIATAKSQSRSIGQAAGSTPTQLTAEAIIAMSPEEFEALYLTPEGKAMIDSL